MTSKRKLYREDEKLFFLHSYYQSGMSKHAFCRAHGICCPALLNSWIKKYSNLAEGKDSSSAKFEYFLIQLFSKAGQQMPCARQKACLLIPD